MQKKNTSGCAMFAFLAGSAVLMPTTIVSAATGTEALAPPKAAVEATESYQIAQVSVGDVVNAATEEVNKATEAATAEATGATEAAEAEATEAAEAETTEAAEAETTEAAETEAAEAETTEAAETEAAESETAEATETAETEASDSDALTTEGFDMSTASSLIDSSSLSEMEKMTLKTALEQAQSNPALLDAALQQARGALGM